MLFANACGGGSASSTAAASAAPPAPPATLQISPASATLGIGGSQAFTASLSDGSAPTGLAWTVSGGGGVSSSPAAPTVDFTASSSGSFTLTAADAAGTSASAAITVTALAAAPARLFPSAAANWLYSAPTGTGLDISSAVASLGIGVNAHDQGFDYPVVDTDGTHGCTTFTDTLQYAYTDRICVPNPANGYDPSVGAWGADDGHLVVMDTANGDYYDFWKLYTTDGVPNSTNVGGIVQGSLSGNGTPGNTAAEITGLAGDILPGELDCGTCLNHALNVIVPSSMNSDQVGHQGPAVKTDGGVPGAIFREGAKIRFDPTVNVDSLSASTAVKAIMRALQLYGGVITDQTGANSIGFYSALATTPDQTGMNLILRHLWIYY